MMDRERQQTWREYCRPGGAALLGARARATTSRYTAQCSSVEVAYMVAAREARRPGGHLIVESYTRATIPYQIRPVPGLPLCKSRTMQDRTAQLTLERCE